ncbi:retrotransposon protein, putative, ty3-gypsy subclass [Tanacetum coccineum]
MSRIHSRRYCTGPRRYGGGDDCPPTYHIPISCEGCFINQGKGTRKPNLGGSKAGRLDTRQETQNLGLKKITNEKGPVPIQFEWDDKKTLMPLVLAERKATQFDLKPHMQSQLWAYINAGIQQHLQKLYNTNKASLKPTYWVINLETKTYDVETFMEGRPESITLADWDAQIAFWNDPRNQSRAAQNRQNRAKSTVVCRQGSRSLARLRDQMEETLRLKSLGSNTESGVPYTDEEINALARKGKQSDDKFSKMLTQYESTPESGNGSGKCGDDEMADDEDNGEDEEDEEDGDS